MCLSYLRLSETHLFFYLALFWKISGTLKIGVSKPCPECSPKVTWMCINDQYNNDLACDIVHEIKLHVFDLQQLSDVYLTVSGYNSAYWVIFHAFCCLLIFQNHLFWKILSGIPSKCQAIWIQVRPIILSGLIWVKTVCKGYQQTTLVGKSLSRHGFWKGEFHVIPSVFVTRRQPAKIAAYFAFCAGFFDRLIHKSIL